MEIGPVSGREPIEQPQRQTSKGSQQTTTAPKGAPDRVEISPDARALLSELADQKLAQQGREIDAAEPAGDMPNDRLEAIRRRIEEGYYSREDVMNKIVDRIIDDFGIDDGIENEP